MIVVDLNLLVYSINEDAAAHDGARRWWESALSGSEPVGLAWTVVLGFLRLTTNARLMPQPLQPKQAVTMINDWFAQPVVAIVEPGQRHWQILQEILAPLGTGGNLTSDAHLAALAIEHGARLFSADNDFSRFQGLRWVNPIAG